MQDHGVKTRWKTFKKGVNRITWMSWDYYSVGDNSFNYEVLPGVAMIYRDNFV